jgi:DNA gyrase subunit B
MSDRYSASQINVVEWYEYFRKHPQIFVGSTTIQGLYNLIFALIYDGVEDILNGECDRIEITINCDRSITVTDNGQGIPIDFNPQTRKLYLEEVMTGIAVKKNSDRNKYQISGVLHGCEIAFINALSEWLKVTVWKDDKIYTQSYARGIKTTEVETSINKDGHDCATRRLHDRTKSKSITFLPDLEIFTEGIELDVDVLAKRLQELAYLNAGSSIALKDSRKDSNKQKTYHFPNGVRSYLAEINKNKEHLHPEIIYILEEIALLKIEIALQWCKNDSYRILSYVNLFPTSEGGTHIEGFKDAIVETINSFLTPSDRIISWEKIQEGLNGIISVKILDPIFTGCMGTKLDNPEVYEAVKTFVSKALQEYLNVNPQLLKELEVRASHK